MRYRFGIESCESVFESGQWVEGTSVTCFEPAGHLIASSWFHIAPGAINTFALIVSSFTVVQALRYAKKVDLDHKVRTKLVTRYLGATTVLAILFLTLKMIEWFIGFPLPEFLAEYNHGDTTIKSLYQRDTWSTQTATNTITTTPHTWLIMVMGYHTTLSFTQ